MKRITIGLLAATALTGGAQAATEAGSAAVDRFVAVPAVNPASAAEVKATCDAYLARAGELRRALEAQTGRATVEATWRRYDDLQRVLSSAGSDGYLVGEVAADDARRDAGRACAGRVQDEANAISLSRPIYDRLKAISLAGADPVTRHLVTRTLQAYDRAGVGGDAAQRKAVEALQAKITADGLAFDANIANGRKTVKAPPAELAGLPADFIAAHKPAADGTVEISTDYPDLQPVMSYARSDALRQRLMTAYLTRAPGNDAVLSRMLISRDQLAKSLGRPNFAALALEDKMVGTPAKATELLDQLSAVEQAPAERDRARLAARLKQIDPAAELASWNNAYAGQLVRKERYDVDPQEVRRYFSYNNVRTGILQLTQDLFGVTIRPWKTPVWDPAVEAYEMYEGPTLIGRFYLDTHPRPGKYSHANQLTLRNGIAGRAVPIGALVTNFPAGNDLMEFRDVTTFLHEFGHLLHAMFSGRVGWEQANMGNLEWDFIEAPSQMLENWVYDYDTLAKFAKDKDGNVIPRPLVERLNKARYFGEGLGDRQQLAYANVSLSYHMGPPPADLTAAYQQAERRYSLVPSPVGTQPQDSFGHLSGYSAFYYTYMWSKVIATDLFTRFEANGLRDPATARRYRDTVLAPGGSKPAGQLVSDFLGRPLSLDAYKAELAKGD